MEEVVAALSRLSLSSDPKQDLHLLKAALLGFRTSPDTVLPRGVDLKALFDAFNTSDNEQVELAVQVMSQLLPLVSPQESLERFKAELLRGFHHPAEDVRRLVLKQLLLCVECEAGISSISSDPEMLHSVLKSVGDASLGVVKLAIKVLVKVCGWPAGLSAVFSQGSQAVLQEMMAQSDSARFNVYECVVEVSLLGDAALSAGASSGILDRLISEVTKGDGLTQLTALQLLIPLALSPGGRALLDRKGVTGRLMYLLSLAKSDPMARLLTHGLLEFFGNIGRAQPQQTLEEHGTVAVMVLQLAAGRLDLDGDPSLQASAIRTVALIGTSPEGKMALAKYKYEMDQVLETVGTDAVRGPSNLKVVSLDALTQLFHLEPQEQLEEVVATLELWWASTLDLQEVVKLAHLPFPDIHCSALRLITSLATFPWGQRLICSEPGLVEYILDRTTESDKQGMEAKWTLVKTLVESPSAASTFPEDHLARMEKFQRQGPFYVEAQVEVALEGHE